MSGRRFGRLVLVALVAGVAYWVYKDRPTASGLIDSITNPLMGSKAAVQSSERNRVVGDATAAVTEQTDSTVASLHEGMTTAELRSAFGEPDKIEKQTVDGVRQIRWTYSRLHRALVLQDDRVVSISII